MQESANLLLGIVMVVAVLTLVALFVVRSKQRKKDNVQIDRREMFPPATEPVTEGNGKFAFLRKIFMIFRRKKTDVEPEASGPEMTQTLDALEAISENENSGSGEATSEIESSGNEEDDRFPELTRTTAEEDLTKAEADVFKGLAGETPATGDENSGESGNAVGGLFGGGADSMGGAFTVKKEVDEVRMALLSRVGAVDIGELSDEIKSLTLLVKEYVPDEVEA